MWSKHTIGENNILSIKQDMCRLKSSNWNKLKICHLIILSGGKYGIWTCWTLEFPADSVLGSCPTLLFLKQALHVRLDCHVQTRDLEVFLAQNSPCIWCFLFMTSYLTSPLLTFEGYFKLTVPKVSNFPLPNLSSAPPCPSTVPTVKWFSAIGSIQVLKP